MSKPVALCILDGWGLSDNPTGNAPLLANTPTIDALMAQFPNATLTTHGPDVGLPKGQMGNSEVGHTNIGAGRVVAMDLGQIDLAIEDQSYFQNEAISEFANAVKSTAGTAHLFSVISDGGVHGHLEHLKATVTCLRALDLPVVIHAITDGRDVSPKSATEYLDDLQANLQGATIGTITGRYYAMDRDNRWERVSTAFDAIVHAKGDSIAKAQAAIDKAYAADQTDEFIPASVVKGYDGIKDGDGLFCLNFRADRAREIMAAIGDPNFDAFDTGIRPKLAAFLGMVSYSDAHEEYMDIAFPKRDIRNGLGEWVAKKGLRQFRLAETEKYPHVTFFLNGGIETPFDAEERFMPPSPKVATYDLQPEMSAAEVTDKFVAAIESGFDLIITNYANPDMVGHTGDLKAAIASCEAVDAGLAKVLTALQDAGGSMLIIADHGNCEVMIDPETGGPHTAHTTNLVPVIYVNAPEGTQIDSGILADVAPTLLAMMDLEQPSEMTGRSLIA